MKKYLLLLLIPLFALSCSSDDDRTEEEITNDKINHVVSTRVKDLGSDTFDFREHKETSVEIESIKEYKNVKLYIANIEKYLEENPNIDDKELEEARIAIQLNKARITEMEKAYTSPLYTVTFGYGPREDKLVAIGYVSTKFEFIGWDPI